MQLSLSVSHLHTYTHTLTQTHTHIPGKETEHRAGICLANEYANERWPVLWKRCRMEGWLNKLEASMTYSRKTEWDIP